MPIPRDEVDPARPPFSGLISALPPLHGLAELMADQSELVPDSVVKLVNPLVHTNAGDFSRSFRRQLFWRNAVQHEAQAPIRLGHYNDAWVTGYGPHFVSCQGAIVSEYRPVNMTDAQVVQHLRQDLPAVHVIGPMLFAAYPGLRIWGHWLLNMLPRIVFAERLWPGRFHYVLPEDVAPSSTSFFNRQIAESLAAYGVGADRIFVMKPDFFYVFETLFDFTGMPGDTAALNPVLLQAMRTVPALPRGGRRHALTAILRGAHEARALTNYAEITALLERRGAGILDANTASFAHQLMAFRDSDIIVGEMGSNLSAVAFAQPGTAVISLAPSGWEDGFLTRLLQMNDALHADLRGPSEADTHDAMRTARYTVPASALNDALDAIQGWLAQRPLGDAVTVDGRPIARRMGEAMLTIGFAQGGNADAFELQGFYAAEKDGRWSEGERASLTLGDFVPPPEGFWLEIEGIGHEAPPALMDTPVEISVNDEVLARFDVGRDTRLQVLVPGSTPAPLRVGLYHPVCPPFGSVTGSDDMRRLGFFYKRITVRRRG